MAILPQRSETTHLLVHCSATPTGSLQEFRKYHVDVNGWLDIGYNKVIGNGQGMPDGAIEPGREISAVGAHCPGYNNVSIGICLVGDTDKTPPTKAQMDTLIKTLADLCVKYRIPVKNILGHRETPAGQAGHKTCPGNLVDMNQIRSLVQKRLSS